MLGWSSIGKLAVSLFYRRWNEIDVHIEDTGSITKAVYKNLLIRLLGSRFKIIEIFPIGNREKVIEESKHYSNSNRKSLFIIDGDLDSILDGDVEGGTTLFRLKRYCIENYLVDFRSLPVIVCEDCCQYSEEQAASEMRLSSWVELNEGLSKRLYVVFCLLRSFYPSNRTISLRIGPFISDQTGHLSEIKISAFESQKLSEIKNEFGNESLLNKLKFIENKISEKRLTMLEFCSGKDFLFPLLNLYIRGQFPIKCNGDSLKVRLSKICNTESLNELLEFCERE